MLSFSLGISSKTKEKPEEQETTESMSATAGSANDDESATMEFADNLTLTNLMSRNKPKKKSTDVVNEENSGWQKEKEVFELQLTQLQEQLVAAMVQNQELAEHNKTLQKHNVEELNQLLEEEQKKRKNAEDRFKRIIEARKRRGSEYDVSSSELEHESVEQDHEPSDGIKGSKRTSCRRKLLEYKILAWNCVHERISDFINDADAFVEEEEEEELTVKKLKENVSRFTDAIQPIKKGFCSLSHLFKWSNPWLTVTVFCAYMYSFWLDVYIPMTFMVMLLQLAVNYLHARGIAQPFTHRKLPDIEDLKEQEPSSSLSEKYQLVLSIARTVQNKLGMLADSLEKLENLLLWQHREASRTLFCILLLAFSASCVLPTNQFLILFGLGMGVKLFVVTPVYKRFPKVERRYDNILKLWNDLPTDAENAQRKMEELEMKEEDEKDSFNKSSLAKSSENDGTNVAETRSENNVSWDTIVLCDRFQLPKTETALHDWVEGRRCTLMNRDNPLSSMKHGRLYLTTNYICFERNQFHSKKNLSIKLTDVISMKKCKPISFMPGSGMAIEVVVTDISKPYIFAAMMGRDEAFDSIIRAGKSLNLPWAK